VDYQDVRGGRKDVPSSDNRLTPLFWGVFFFSFYEAFECQALVSLTYFLNIVISVPNLFGVFQYGVMMRNVCLCWHLTGNEMYVFLFFLKQMLCIGSAESSIST
jgi:hypothetical protein